MKIRIGITKQIIIAVSVLSIVCALATGLIVFNIEKNVTENLIIEDLTNTTELAYNMMAASIHASIKNYLRSIADSGYYIAKNEHERYLNGEITLEEAKVNIEERLLEFVIGDTGYMFVIDSEGLVQVHKEIKGQDLSLFTHVENMIREKDGYHEYLWKNPSDVISRDKGAYVSYYEPLDYIIVASSYKTEFEDLLLISDFEENLEAIRIGEDGYMFVLDNKGKGIILPKDETIDFEAITNLIGYRESIQLITKDSGVIDYETKVDNDGNKLVNRRLVFKRYEPMDWIICSTANMDELYSLYSKSIMLIIIIIMGIILVISLIASLYSKKLLKPIEKLNEFVKKLSKRQYNVEFDINRKDEFGDLFQAFSAMAKKTNAIRGDLELANNKYEEINKNLESMVIERTLELSSKQEELKNEVDVRKRIEEKLISQNSELEEIKGILGKTAITDSLTGLYNRHYFDEFYHKIWEDYLVSPKEIALLMIDIDCFKIFNDTYGHVAGDKCLKQVADEIRRTLDNKKDFYARYGGEEFIVLLLNRDKKHALEIAERLRINIRKLEIENKNSISGKSRITISVGLYAFNDFKTNSIEKTIIKADMALYKAKRNGRDKVESSDEE